MSAFSFRQIFLVLLSFLIFVSAGGAQEMSAGAETRKGKAPIIIIPGLTGSELVNSKTGELVWFKLRRAKTDDIRLPISPNLAQNRDNLVPRDIIRSVQIIKFLPETEIYERLTGALEKRGYKEGKWDAPPKNGFEDTFYVFAYDWRRDNVENARLLMRQIDALKRKLKKPRLKFNVIAHSMGGLIARYAAMYGKADLPTGKPRPTWAGAWSLDKVFLLGTPNEGSVYALKALLDGFSYFGGGLNLPFVQNISRFDTFTIPSLYQLLPHEKTFLAFDENLKQVEVDVFDPKTWEKYDWSIFREDAFSKKFNATEQRNAKAYFPAVLARARRFQQALNANSSAKIPVSFYLMGADCKETLNSVVLHRDAKKNRWRTLFKEETLEREDGQKVLAEELKKIIYGMGDGVVTKSSLIGETIMKINGNKLLFPITDELFLCEGHGKLATNVDIQDKLFTLIWGEVVTQNASSNQK